MFLFLNDPDGCSIAEHEAFTAAITTNLSERNKTLNSCLMQN